MKKTTFSGNSLSIEPYAELLQKPVEGALLYKIVSPENFFDMFEKCYLYFRRVDTYADDKRDSDQPDKDKEISYIGKFESNPNYTAMNYYALCRAKTYACCFSTQKTQHLFEHYGKSNHNALCLVFDCHKLIKFLNQFFDKSYLLSEKKKIDNFFCINYGLVVYGDFDETFLKKGLPSPVPIQYVYYKNAEKYGVEQEFRIALSDCLLRFSAPTFNFSESIQFSFDFVKALEAGVLKEIVLEEKCEDLFREEFRSRLGKLLSSEQLACLLRG